MVGCEPRRENGRRPITPSHALSPPAGGRPVTRLPPPAAKGAALARRKALPPKTTDAVSRARLRKGSGATRARRPRCVSVPREAPCGLLPRVRHVARVQQQLHPKTNQEGKEPAMSKADQLAPSVLNQFTGSAHWYRHWANREVLLTDGAMHVADHGGAYWLLDEIVFAQK